jgi:O-antigen ligase
MMNMRTGKSISRLLPAVGLIMLAMMSAFVLGAGGALFGWFGQVFLLTVLIPAVMVAYNYRFGLLALVVLMPFSGAQFIPKAGPLSIINLLLLGVLSLLALRLVLKHMNGQEIQLPIPRQYLLLYLVPITIGFIVGTPHLKEIPEHLLEEDGKNASFNYYWISTYLKGMLFSLCGIALGAAIAEYRKVRIFVFAAIGSAVLYVFATGVMFAFSSNSLEAAVNSRQMYSATGRHANGVGAMLLPILGAALYMKDAAGTRAARAVLSIVALILVGGVLLTGSRGAFLGMFAVLLVYVWHRRKVRTVFATVALGAIVLMAAPAAITDRLTMGLDRLFSDQGTDLTRDDERLTSGRVHLAMQLLPEVAQSPLIGRGMGSTRWSDYAKSGGPISHPHNLYLTTLLDMGIAGLLCMVLFGRYIFKLFAGLARDKAAEPLLRAYFAGTLAGFVGYLFFGFSGGYPFPQIEQWFLWVGIGVALGYRTMLDTQAPAAAPQPLAPLPANRVFGVGTSGKGFWPGSGR